MDFEEGHELTVLLSQNLLPGQEVNSCTVHTLDSGGLHFSSDVKEVQAHLRNKDGTSQKLQLVMKVLPGREKQIENNSELGFTKESAFYQLVVPIFSEIQEKYNLEVNHSFPKLFTATKGVIILEDLRTLNYFALKDRLDEAHTKLVLRELARFHATGIALKLSSPDIFQSKLGEVVVPALRNAKSSNIAAINNKLRQEVAALLKSTEGFEHFADPVDVIIQSIDNEKLPSPQEPYATLVHNDLWLGNILFKSSPSDTPVRVAFIDFQNTVYNSPAREIVYFLFTSVEKNVLVDFESLILFYHQHFVNCLTYLGCEKSRFTFPQLMEEVNLYGPTKLKHMILLLKVLSCHSDNYEISFKKNICEIISLFEDRNWL